MGKWIAEFDLEDGDTMPEHMEFNYYMGGKIDFHCRPMWIPCSERLPMKGTQVLCCNKYGSVFTSELTWSKGYLKFGQHYNVIAWQPLPEPYKLESEE